MGKVMFDPVNMRAQPLAPKTHRHYIWDMVLGFASDEPEARSLGCQMGELREEIAAAVLIDCGYAECRIVQGHLL